MLCCDGQSRNARLLLQLFSGYLQVCTSYVTEHVGGFELQDTVVPATV